MHLAAIEDPDWINEKSHFWSDVYGFKMSCMKDGFYYEGQVDVFAHNFIVTSTNLIKHINIQTSTVTDLDFISPFELKVNKSSRIHGFLGWFDIVFDKCFPDQVIQSVEFSTGPFTTPTHWKQTAFALREPIDVIDGIGNRKMS